MPLDAGPDQGPDAGPDQGAGAFATTGTSVTPPPPSGGGFTGQGFAGSLDAGLDQGIDQGFTGFGQAVTPGQGATSGQGAITVEGIRAKLVGMDAWLAAAEQQVVPYDTARIRKNIPAMIRRFERETTVQIRACQVITRDDGTFTKRDATGKLVGSTGLPIKKEEAYTYYPDDAYSYFITNLKTRPVQSIERVRIMFGNTTVLEIPAAWYEMDGQSGVFQILPVSGSLLNSAYSSSFALLQSGFGNRNFIPHSVHFDYTAGLPDGWQDDDEYADLLRILESFCALSVLEDIAHLADAGLSGKSISGGGSGESYQYTRFMDRKAELQKSVDDFAALWKQQQAPLLMAAL